MVTAASMCLLLLTGCVPGQSIDSLAKQPEAALTYPGSTDVRINNDPGRVQFGLDGGDVAVTGISGTTTHTQREVIAFYSRALAANGWTQTTDTPGAHTEAGLPSHWISWDRTKLHLGYLVEAWTEGATTKYYTQLRSFR
ncbi:MULTISPECIES: hypothetical protein [unclassified Cryobacterium]|uniref:hypothetical protein n=1 Tax=unclassified Cryobacterium TaxID=2649013 RepID=UPI002AC903DD|nr:MULTISPECIES: hypothetical protein [Cryobacterium]MEB0005052.1 hypothetical protein [Cryobacterium sp. RTC2.1]MEB0203634.1 hypothetical protein [Cryobacterium sp. 5I3]MEB0287868.1 hypothetical protein [Cryobacterium sp. 10S3]MEB0307508.1 hypothetical protein [Cryobacterium sp. 10I1]MEC5151289.1 hypothetical protein [Cryobacterium psychrotolerans]